MSKQSKRFTQLKEKVDKNQVYGIEDAIKLVKETANTKFDSSIEVHVKLGIDPKKGDQIVRSSVALPHGSGKIKKIAAFVTPAKEKEAKEAGADLVGGKELIDKIKKDGKCDFEIAVAVPDIMKDLAVIAKTLGQKGLMPNPKVGTVTNDVKKIIEEIKKGKADFKNDDSANVHLMIGKASFTEDQLKDNFLAFAEALKKAKPETMKGTYIKSAFLSSTMGPGIKVNL